MSPSRVLLIGSLAVPLAISSPGQNLFSQGRSRYAVASLGAKAYLHNQGRFSPGLLDNPKIALWNAPIGEGTVGGPSDDTFLEVMVVGAPRDTPDSLLLRVVAFTDSDTLLDREVQVGRFNTNGRFYSAYWLYDTGCEPITVQASLRGEGAGRGLQRVIPYDCGD